MSSLIVRLCDWDSCPSIKADGKAADKLATTLGYAILILLLIWLITKEFRIA